MPSVHSLGYVQYLVAFQVMILEDEASILNCLVNHAT